MPIQVPPPLALLKTAYANLKPPGPWGLILFFFLNIQLRKIRPTAKPEGSRECRGPPQTQSFKLLECGSLVHSEILYRTHWKLRNGHSTQIPPVLGSIWDPQCFAICWCINVNFRNLVRNNNYYQLVLDIHQWKFLLINEWCGIRIEEIEIWKKS